jgi:hypothetical protein
MLSCAVLVAFLVQTPTAAVYRNDTSGFDLTIPAGWVQMPDSLLQAGIRTLIQHGANPRQTRYVAAFGRAPVRDWHAYPYVIIQVEPADEGDAPLPPHILDSIVANLNGSALPPTGNDLIARTHGQMTARYDSASDAVTAQLPTGLLADGRSVVGFIAIKVGRRGLVSVNVYGMAADSVATAAIRDRFLAGFKVTQP